MPHDRALYQWQGRVAMRFDGLPSSHAGWLANASYAIALAGSAAVSSAALRLAITLGVGLQTARERLRELYLPASAKAGRCRAELDHVACFGPLLRWAAAGSPGRRRLALAIDPTDLSGRLLILTASVLYHRCAIPVAWHVQPAHAAGSWNDRWAELLGELRRHLGEGWEVVVLSDRGLESAELFRVIASLGWHPLMRVKGAGTFRPDGWHKARPMRWFADGVGRRWAGPGVAYPGSGKLRCTLLASWTEGHEQAWLILTDLAPRSADAAWYGWRAWIEQGFKRLKSGGWQLEKNRMGDPDRLARWLAAVALATLWALETGGGDEAMTWAGGLAGVGTRGPSLFELGSAWLRAALAVGARLPRGRWHRAKWVRSDLPSDPLKEEDLRQAAQGLPL